DSRSGSSPSTGRSGSPSASPAGPTFWGPLASAFFVVLAAVLRGARAGLAGAGFFGRGAGVVGAPGGSVPGSPGASARGLLGVGLAVRAEAVEARVAVRAAATYALSQLSARRRQTLLKCLALPEVRGRPGDWRVAGTVPL